MDETVVVRLDCTISATFDAVEFRPSPDGLTVVQGDNGAGKIEPPRGDRVCLHAAVVPGSTPRGDRATRCCRSANFAATSWPGAEKWRSRSRSCPDAATAPGTMRQRVPGIRGLLEVLRTTLFTPDDLVLVKGPPGGRRDFVDEVLAKAHPRLGATARRSTGCCGTATRSCASSVAGSIPRPRRTLDVWDDRLAQIGERLATSRDELVQSLSPLSRGSFRDPRRRSRAASRCVMSALGTGR